jgi:hypothetical protein
MWKNELRNSVKQSKIFDCKSTWSDSMPRYRMRLLLQECPRQKITRDWLTTHDYSASLSHKYMLIRPKPRWWLLVQMIENFVLLAACPLSQIIWWNCTFRCSRGSIHNFGKKWCEDYFWGLLGMVPILGNIKSSNIKPEWQSMCSCLARQVWGTRVFLPIIWFETSKSLFTEQQIKSMILNGFTNLKILYPIEVTY